MIFLVGTVLGCDYYQGNMPLYLMEVQTGVYQSEDDIIRYDDKHARNLLNVKNTKPELKLEQA